jgi:chorismate mutase
MGTSIAVHQRESLHLDRQSNVDWLCGPCSAESREQVLETAASLARLGVRKFRAGVWKPRSRPDTFEGAGTVALDWLAEARSEYGLEVWTEAATPAHVEQVVAAGLDGVWVGARTTVNPFAVQELAEALASTGLKVILKNPINPDLGLWQGAIERIRKVGITDFAVCHRGFSVYEASTFRNPPLWEIPLELKRRNPELKLFCDPSHISGARQLVSAVAQTALNYGFDGLMVEVHPAPATALSDAAQQLTPQDLAELMSSLTVPTTDPQSAGAEYWRLELLRERINSIDQSILHYIAQRMAIARDIGAIKQLQDMSLFQLERWQEVFQSRKESGQILGLSEYFLNRFLQILHLETLEHQQGTLTNN